MPCVRRHAHAHWHVRMPPALTAPAAQPHTNSPSQPGPQAAAPCWLAGMPACQPARSAACKQRPRSRVLHKMPMLPLHPRPAAAGPVPRRGLNRPPSLPPPATPSPSSSPPPPPRPRAPKAQPHLAHVRAKQVPCAARAEAPPLNILRVRPQQVAHGAVVRHLLLAVNRADLGGRAVEGGGVGGVGWHGWGNDPRGRGGWVGAHNRRLWWCICRAVWGAGLGMVDPGGGFGGGGQKGGLLF